MFSNVSVTLTPDQAAQLLLFCGRQEKALNRRINRLNAQVSGTWNEIYAVSDLAAKVNSANNISADAYSSSDY